MITDKIEKAGHNLNVKAHEAQDAYEDIRGEASDIVDRVSTLGKQANETVQKAWNKALKNGTQLGDRLVTSSGKSLKSVSKMIEKRPVQAAAAALALGFVVGAILIAVTSSSESDE